MNRTSRIQATTRPIVMDAGQGPAMWFLNSRMTVKATAETTGGAYGLLESVIPAGFSPPLHVHHREDESYFLLEGRLTLRRGDQISTANAGSFVLLPREIPHSFVVEGDAPARMLTLITPGGGEGFFIDLSRPATNDGLPADGPLDIERLRQVSDQYGDEIVGPPLRPGSAT